MFAEDPIKISTPILGCSSGLIQIIAYFSKMFCCHLKPLYGEWKGCYTENFVPPVQVEGASMVASCSKEPQHTLVEGKTKFLDMRCHVLIIELYV